MLKFLREKRTLKTLLWILAIVVITAFVLWGTPTRFNRRDDISSKYAGEVFGKKVPFDEFADAYQASRNQAIMIYGQRFQEYAPFIDLEENAWNRLILLKTAEKRKIKTTNKEVIEKIKLLPFFQKNGKFDLETYNLVLNYVFRINAREFEEQIRQSLSIDKLVQEISSEVKITEDELESAYSRENDTAKVIYTLIKEEDFKEAAEIATGEMEAFYQKNRDNFKKPQQVNVKYIKIDFESQKDKISVSDNEIKNYYAENKEQFKKTTEGEEEAENPVYLTLKETKDRIEDIIASNKTQEKALELADEIADSLYENASLEEVAEEFSLPVNETGFFSTRDSIPDIGWSYQFLMTAFQLEKDQVSDVVETPKGYYILKMIDKKKPYVPLLSEIKEEVKEALLKEKSRQKAKEKAQSILAALKEEKNKGNFDFKKTIEKMRLTVSTTEDFKRDGYIPNIGETKEFTDEAFKLDIGQISDVIEVARGYVILKVLDKKPFDGKKFAEEKANFRNKVLEDKRQQHYMEWFDNLKQKANLKNTLSLLTKE